MRAVTRVTFFSDNGEKFFGEGPCRLMRAIEETGSLRAAAASMGMAYTKALRLMKNAEAAIGCPLSRRTVGGKAGGGSVLTPEGKEWLGRYEAYRDACARVNDALYLDFFPEQREAAPVCDGWPAKRENHPVGRAACCGDARYRDMGGAGQGGIPAGNAHGRNGAHRRLE